MTYYDVAEQIVKVIDSETMRNIIYHRDTKRYNSTYTRIIIAGHEWYIMSAYAMYELCAVVKILEEVPEKEWRQWEHKEINFISNLLESADRLVRCGIVMPIDLLEQWEKRDEKTN